MVGDYSTPPGRNGCDEEKDGTVDKVERNTLRCTPSRGKVLPSQDVAEEFVLLVTITFRHSYGDKGYRCLLHVLVGWRTKSCLGVEGGGDCSRRGCQVWHFGRELFVLHNCTTSKCIHHQNAFREAWTTSCSLFSGWFLKRAWLPYFER